MATTLMPYFASPAVVPVSLQNVFPRDSIELTPVLSSLAVLPTTPPVPKLMSDRVYLARVFSTEAGGIGAGSPVPTTGQLWPRGDAL